MGALSKLLGKLLDNTSHKSTRNWTVDSWLPKLPTVLLSPRQGQEVSNVITIVVTISHFFFLSITVTMSYIPIPIFVTTPSCFTAIVIHTSYFFILVHHCIIQACKITPKSAQIHNTIAQIDQNRPTFCIFYAKKVTGLRKIHHRRW